MSVAKVGDRTKQLAKNFIKSRREDEQQQGCSRQSGPDNASCMENIGSVMLYLGNQVNNFRRQKRSVETFSKIISKKGAKKDSFANATKYLSSSCSNTRR